MPRIGPCWVIAALSAGEWAGVAALTSLENPISSARGRWHS